VALVIEGLLNIIFSPDQVTLHASYIDTSWSIVGGFYLPYVRVFFFLMSIVLLTGLYFLVYRTQFGYSLRASMQNRIAAELIGIDVKKVSMLTFAIGVALTAAGGMAYGAANLFNAASSYDLISRLLVIIVLGGMGSLRGAFWGAMTMLIVKDLTTVFWGPQWSSTVFFVTLVVLLVFRPQGLFGQLGGRKQ